MSGEAAGNDAERLYQRLLKEADQSGYHLNPDQDFALQLAQGLAANRERYGYALCPCRLTGGSREADIDIICPCDYRDADLDEYGCCYCGLYVSRPVLEGKEQIGPIPERRKQGEAMSESRDAPAQPGGKKIWRCRVCGYLCARESPPEVCPICKVPRERFEPFQFT